MTDRYAVIGNPITHSLSPTIHHAFAQQTGRTIHYTKIKSPLKKLKETVLQFQNTGGKGANITAPFKEEAYKLATQLTEAAKLAQAVNTFRFDSDGSILGDNTDGAGFIQDVYGNQKGAFEKKSVLLLGAGGAIRGLLAPILEHHPARLVIANRTLEKAEQLAAFFSTSNRPIEVCSLDKLNKKKPFDWVIHGIASCLSPVTYLLPDNILAPGAWCYDLNYGRSTDFPTWAKRNAALKCLDGLGLLVEQAALSFYLWHGVKPETRAMLVEM